MTLRDLASLGVASLPTPLRWRTRNAIALARWLRFRGAGERAETPYAEGFWDQHAGGDWDGFAEVVLRFCTPVSLVDVGCGDGKLLAAIRRRDAGLRLLGIDGSRAALARAVSAGLPVLYRDLSSTRTEDIAALRAPVAEFDVALSLETAEHLPPWAGAGFVDSLARVRLVVFSGAQPGQGGTLHMNERPPAYWRARFAERGFAPAASDAAFRSGVAALDLPPWYGANVQLFERRG